MDKIIVRAKAREFLKKNQVQVYPVDAVTLAVNQGFKVNFDDNMDRSQAGFSLKMGSKKIIIVNDNDLHERKRFTILHEVAHDYLDLPSRHSSGISKNELETFSTRPPEEIACDMFAAECLVPWFLIRPLTEDYAFDADSMDELSGLFQASRSCISSRFSQESDEMLVYVISEGGIIKNVTASQTVINAKYWIEIGKPVPNGSLAHQVFNGSQSRQSVEYNASVWSDSHTAGRFYCFEEVISAPSWDQCLSLLTLEEKTGEKLKPRQKNSWAASGTGSAPSA